MNKRTLTTQKMKKKCNKKKTKKNETPVNQASKQASEQATNARRNNYNASKTGNENLRFAMQKRARNHILYDDKDDLYSTWLSSDLNCSDSMLLGDPIHIPIPFLPRQIRAIESK